MSAHILLHKLLSMAKDWALPTVLALSLIPVLQSSVLLFHILVELFAVAVAVISFIVAWNTYTLSKNNYLLIVGCGYLVVGLLDLAHALTFAGMPFMPDHSGNATVQLWIVARFFEAFVLLLAPFFVCKDIRPGYVLSCLLVLMVLALAAIKFTWLPDMMVLGSGLTQAKIYSEYSIAAVLALALLGLWYQRQRFDRKALYLIGVSILLTIAAELAFTLYVDLHGQMLVLGHFLKLFSFWAIYLVLIESSLKQPFKNLSREANTYDAVPDETIVIDHDGIVRQVNQAVRNNSGLSSQQCLGLDCHELQHDVSISKQDCILCQAISNGQQVKAFELFEPRRQQWYQIAVSDIRSAEQRIGLVHVRRNITNEKKSQARTEILNRLYMMLSHTNKVISQSLSRDQMFQQVCDIAVLHGGFKMAWIGLIDELLISPLVYSGDEGGYLKTMKISLDDNVLANGPVGKTARLNQVHYINDTKTDQSFAPWRDAATQRGFQALAAVPVCLNEQVVAIFTIYSTQPQAFDSEMLSLLATLGRDISLELQRVEERLKRQQAELKVQQLSQTVEQSSNAVIITDTQLNIEYVNKAFSILTGYQAAEVIGQGAGILNYDKYFDLKRSEVVQMLKAGREWVGEHKNQRKDGSEYWALHTLSTIKNQAGDITHFVSTSNDNSELHNAQQTIEQLAFYDPLTDLPNRRLLSDRLHQAIEYANRYKNHLVVAMVFDLDNFKFVNDSFGHNYGDELLKIVGDIFLQQVRASDTVSRQGGDEFTLILGDRISVNKAADIADNIIRKLKQPIDVLGNQVVIGTSIGISVYPHDAKDAQELLSNADMAMYHAKAEGKNNFQFFTDEMNQRAHDRLVLENDLRQAIEKQEFELYYQPQIDLASGNILGAEALIRWLHPSQGFISPAEFIPLAEETGLIAPIGDWVIAMACQQAKQLQQQYQQNFKIAINVSAFQFQNGEQLIDSIQTALELNQLDAQYLAVELTESILIDDINETISVLTKLRELNISVAIDDFGTGYSSLSYLKQLPIDILKIDQSFIRDISTDASDKAIVSAIIAMARKLDICVLAEGVELAEHQAFLLEQGCNSAQGYLYCRPVPFTEFLQHILSAPSLGANE